MNTLTEALRSSVVWTVREWRRKGARVVEEVVLRRKNLQTNFGLTAFASAFQGTYAAPTYLVIESLAGLIQNVGGIGVGATSVQLDVAVDETGDTSLVLGLNTANQETVTFSARSGTGPYTYTIAATAKTHAQNDVCVRLVLATDGMAQVQSEVQYDAVNAPTQRMASLGGYSQGAGNWTMQFFFAGTQALGTGGIPLLFANCGLADSVTVGAGNLHNHINLGYSHTSGNDAEIDVSLTLIND